ncbi:hypothetical protein P148_SR1C00001G0647 [candidate division SR1 bacterium RAAC1_SR1_1]|nr:hypothetical protein P148_SR1C00001G0647 [candidate division SR1 bacterium RAAC1_SR1_1]
MAKILITGSNGMLAYDLIPILQQSYEVVGYDRELLDITNIENIKTILEKEQVSIIINCAAYTNVDAAEDEGKLVNYQVNAFGIYLLAKICKNMDIDLIHISTDYVFDGTKKSGYLPQDIPNPINQYGMAKYLGEQLLKSEYPNAILVRTSWLYGGGSQFKNFVNTMLKLAETRNELKVVNDQFGSPTYSKDLSKAILDIINNIGNYRGNIFHLCNQTQGNGITWYDFAQEIFRLTQKNIDCQRCTSEEFLTKAKRPQYSKLTNDNEIVLRSWKEGLEEYVKYI